MELHIYDYCIVLQSMLLVTQVTRSSREYRIGDRRILLWTRIIIFKLSRGYRSESRIPGTYCEGSNLKVMKFIEQSFSLFRSADVFMLGLSTNT